MTSKIKVGCLIVVLLLGITIIIGNNIFTKTQAKDVDATIYQLKMTDTDGGACYGIQLPSGKLIMIDGGYMSDGESVATFIREHGGVVSDWFITHPHFDHVGGLISIMENQMDDIIIEKVYYSEFSKDFFTEEADGKNLEILNTAVLLDEFQELTNSSNATFIPVVRDDVLDIEGISITCMNGFDEYVYDVNANSLVLHFDFGKTTFMVTGDITDESITNMIEHYGENDKLWDVDYVQIPHHGYMAGISSDLLYRLTTPSYAFLDCSLNEFKTDAVNIQTHLNMLHELEVPLIIRFKGDNQCIVGQK